MRNAEQAARRGDADEAAKLYRQVLEVRPRWVPAEFNLALAYHFQKKYAAAIELFSDVVEQDPSVANGYWFRGLDYYEAGQYQNAVASLKRTLELQPGHAEARFYIAASYYQLRDYGRAASEYAEQIRLHPETEDAYLQLIQCYEALRDSALGVIDADVHANYFVLLLEAENDLDQDDFRGAESNARLALRSDPAAPEAWLALGQRAAREGKPADAEAAFERARLKNAAGSPAFRNIVDAVLKRPAACVQAAGLAKAVCAASQTDLSGATRVVVAAIAAQPRDTRTLYWAVQIYRRLMQTAAAKLAQISPNSPSLHKLYARAHDQRGHRIEAAQEYDQALALDSDDASTLIEYANFRTRAQEFTLAIPLLRRALALTPDDNQLQILLGEAYIQNNEPAGAIPLLDSALKAEPGDEQLRLKLAQSLHTLDRAQEAVAILEAAPDDPDGRISYMLGTYYALQGEKERARLAMQTFQARHK